MLEWRKLSIITGFEINHEQAFFLPIKSGGCQIVYGNEYCIIEDLSVMDLINKIKNSNLLSLFPDFKILLEKILEENQL